MAITFRERFGTGFAQAVREIALDDEELVGWLDEARRTTSPTRPTHR